jgi:hypothetical protein
MGVVGYRKYGELAAAGLQDAFLLSADTAMQELGCGVSNGL